MWIQSLFFFLFIIFFLQKVRYDSCSVISVQIPKTSGRITLEMLLRKYFCMEIIRGASCDECKKTTGKVDSGLFKKQGFSKVSSLCFIEQSRLHSYIHTVKANFVASSSGVYFLRQHCPLAPAQGE